jgi:GT2 family glycosyltransferase
VARRTAATAVDVSVIIVNYNVREYLANALESLRPALKGLRSEVIVVDNASTDGSVAMMRASFPRVRLITSPENLGFARANNVAIRKARGRYLLLLNPDTVVQEDTVRVMHAHLEAHRDVGIAGCKILNPDGTFQLAARRSFPTPWVAASRILGLSRLFPGSTLFGRYNLTFRSTEMTYDVDAVSGSFMFVRREAVDRVGGLDERFFM